MMAMVMARRHDIGNAAMSKKVRCADIDIAYEVVGEGTPLVLLHLGNSGGKPDTLTHFVRLEDSLS